MAFKIVDYVESDGIHALETNISLVEDGDLNTAKIEADMQFVEKPTGSSSIFLFGTAYYNSNTSSRRAVACGYIQSRSTTKVTYMNGTGTYGSNSEVFTDSVLDTERHLFIIDQLNKVYGFDELTQAFTGSINSGMTKELVIFGGRSSSTSGAPVNYISRARLYGFRVYFDDVLLCDFRPFYDGEKAGLYDAANDNYWYPTGLKASCVITANSSGAGSVSGGGIYTMGDSATLTATPNTGYTFKQWSDGNQDNPRTITASGDQTFTAVFEAVPRHTILLNASPINAGSVYGSGTYYENESVRIYAIARQGFVFDRWSDGSTTNERNITLTEDLTLTAYFIEAGKIPSRYSRAVSVVAYTGSYIDTGVVPKDDYIIEGLFGCLTTDKSGYVFGARNTNSNTSAGQLNLYLGSTSGYIGYNNTRQSISYPLYDAFFVRFASNGNQLEADRGGTVTDVNGADETFEGTQTIYLGGLNNAGSLFNDSLEVSIYGFIIRDSSGIMLHNFVPVIDTQNGNVPGVFDIVNSNFIAMTNPAYTGGSRIEPMHTAGGNAVFRTYQGDTVESAYYRGKVGQLRFYAIPEEGYTFANWTDYYGNIVSTNREILNGTDSLTANFVKKSDIILNTGYKAMGLEYGVDIYYATHKNDIYADVRSAKVVIDSLQRATTEIELISVPSAYQPNMFIFIKDPKGRVVYGGLIKSIEGNKLVCREPLSIFDNDFLFSASDDKTLVETGLTDLMTNGVYNTDITDIKELGTGLFRHRMFDWASFPEYDRRILSRRNVFSNTLEAREMSVGNLEEYLLNNTTSNGVFIETTLDGASKYRVYFRVFAQEEKETVQISDNVESVTDVNVDVSVNDTTLLIVLNDSGSSLRGMYAIRNDGTIKKLDTSDPFEETDRTVVAYNRYKSEIEMSNDRIASLTTKHLLSGLYNHVITFNLNLDGSMYDLDSLQIGEGVEFYYQGKLYESVITGMQYEIRENDDKIHSVKITLGYVRKNLTSKLNLGRKS